jgi:uncharacterized protein involved in cysteine biosynthesis
VTQSLVNTRKLGFFSGFFRPFSAFGWLARHTELWLLALVPALVLSLLEAGFVSLGYFVLRPWVLEQLPEATSSYGRFGSSLLGISSVGLVAVLGWFLAVPLAPALSAPALERLVSKVELERRVPARADMSFFAEIGCGMRSMGAALLVGLPIFVVCSLIGFFVPFLAPAVLLIELGLTSLLAAWSLFDYPLTLRGIGVRARYGFLSRHATVVFGFGAAFMLAFWWPCCSVLLLPLGVIAATELLWDLLAEFPRELPELERPPRLDRAG